MWYDKYLPFLTETSFISYPEDMDLDVNSLFLPYKTKDIDFDYYDKFSEKLKQMRHRVFYVEPLKIYIVDEPEDYIYWYKSRLNTIKASVTTISYSSIARAIIINKSKDGEINALYSPGLDYLSLKICTPKLVSLASRGLKYKGEDLELEEIEKEQAIFHPNIAIPYREDELIEYLRGKDVYSAIPLLIAPTTLIDSMIIERLVGSLGFRLVNLNFTFIDGTDTCGLIKKEVKEIDSDDWQVTYIEAPFASLIECTDEFIEYCNKALNLIEERLKDNSLTDDIRKSLVKARSYLLEKTKEPVLFINNISRIPDSILNILVNIFSKKKFGQFSMTKAKIIATTNAFLSLKDIDMIDLSTLAKFQPIEVNLEDFYFVLNDWALVNLHPLVWEYLQKSVEDFYDDSDVISLYKETFDKNVFSTVPFPNPKSWKLISQYLYKLDGQRKKEVLPEVIINIIGERVGKKFVEYLHSKDFVLLELKRENNFTEILDYSLSNNLPIFLMVPPAMDIADKINSFTNTIGAILINFDLSLDKMFASGAPVVMDTLGFILGELDGEFLEENEPELYFQLRDLLLESNISPYLATRIPHSRIFKTITKAKKDEKPVILFFNALNKTIGETISYNIVEIMTDLKLIGIDLSNIKDKITLVVVYEADEKHYSTNSLNTTFAGRFIILKKDKLDETDAEDFIEHLKQINANPVLLEFIARKREEATKRGEPDPLLAWMNSLDKLSIVESAPIKQALKNLAIYLNNVRESRMWRGCVVFTEADKTLLDDLQKIFNMKVATKEGIIAKHRKISEFVKKIMSRFENWVGRDEERLSVNVAGADYTLKELWEFLKPYLDVYYDDKKLQADVIDDFDNVDHERLFADIEDFLNGLKQADEAIRDARFREVSSFCGPDFAREFIIYLNEVWGINE